MTDLTPWTRALRLLVLQAPGVLHLAAPALSSTLEPPHVALFHDQLPTAPAPSASTMRQRAARSSRARWLLTQLAHFLPLGRVGGPSDPVTGTPGAADACFDLWSAQRWQRYLHATLVEEGANPLGFVPVIPLINQTAPLAGLDPWDQPGLSEVEPLLGLQDELNTRLSDRASRVTMQSFHMYLAKGIEDFNTRPVGPGQMWLTTNPDATIESFGGDNAAPSEDAHINEVRQAIDKISGVSPIAAGLIRDRIGNLTSAVALKITLIALLARTDKRRTSLTATLNLLARRIFETFDAAGILPTTPLERGIDINWPSALPENTAERLAEAKSKLDLGISRATVLTELGYAEETMPTTTV